jgi:hypothetical protein
LFQRGTEFARRAWHDLLRFESRRSCRPVAILMTEGTRDAYFKASGVKTAARPLESHEFGLPERFVPQRERVLHALRGGAGMSRSLLRLMNPRNWWRASTWQDA